MAKNGMGPAKQVYSLLTDGHGIFGRLGLKEEREHTNEIIGQLEANPN